MRLVSNRDRPAHLGPFPLERLRRGHPRPDGRLAPAGMAAARAMPAAPLATSLRAYHELFRGLSSGTPARSRAPIADDPSANAADLKAAAYFLDASMTGIAARPGSADCALVVVVECPRAPSDEPLAHDWTRDCGPPVASLRAFEIATVLAAYIRHLGWQASAQDDADPAADGAELLLRAGLAQPRGGKLVNPFLGDRFAFAVVATDLPLEPDAPLAARLGLVRGPGWWIGRGGTESGLERLRRRLRPSHASRYPMERIRRVAEPTTLVLEHEVPRVPKRAAFFERALRGDLGAKAQGERGRFATKHPLSLAMIPAIRGMVPLQDGQVASAHQTGLGDATANARAVKSLSYFLGADLTGIAPAKRFAWFSHREDGRPIEPYHANAIVMLIDQGFETMEGASGDDWISGAQSMRAYMRGAEIAGVLAAHIRSLGYSARAQTNADSDVLHIPLILYAGLGEMSRIGELVLNPFVGPRFKSVVVTTDMPLAHDLPIDFGLQDFCRQCNKCARECPCDAIPAGDKVMFNGYETWKPDVERCTRYRLTNIKGSACGRCMKTCPYNNEGLLQHRVALWAAIKLPFLRQTIAIWDDRLGHGGLNPRKKWWRDLEMVDGVAVLPRGVNRRGLDLAKQMDPARQQIAFYHADQMPPPDQIDPVPVDRKAALAAAALIETPEAARRRAAAGLSMPAHYRPTPPRGT
ncbi:4Fe-4S dicluster domain-containing protein [Desertibaculum subflavum]|uniref:4Fe-4S dicluster domain-containing protein n=1 Tax=Desertibaculum subflavum TaxID=2268458 RepID=UPI000E66F791